MTDPDNINPIDAVDGMAVTLNDRTWIVIRRSKWNLFRELANPGEVVGQHYLGVPVYLLDDYLLDLPQPKTMPVVPVPVRLPWYRRWFNSIVKIVKRLWSWHWSVW